jgi:hypothetical protein
VYFFKDTFLLIIRLALICSRYRFFFAEEAISFTDIALYSVRGCLFSHVIKYLLIIIVLSVKNLEPNIRLIAKPSRYF